MLLVDPAPRHMLQPAPHVARHRATRGADAPPTTRTRTVFRFRFGLPFRLAARAFLVTPAHAWVSVDGDPGGEMVARYGPWCLRTPMANLDVAHLRGPLAISRTIGPPHLALDGGLTFASNRDLAVGIGFREPVPGIDPAGVLRHPSLTVTLDDPVAFVALITSMGAPVS